MGRPIFVDCFSGASGDMLLGALLDAGVSLPDLRAGLLSLPIGGWSLDAHAMQSHGLSGTRAKVGLTEPDQPHRGLSEVLRIVRQGSRLSSAVIDRACAVFERLAEVEAHIHGTSVDEVEFHEVGAIDAIIDVVGVVLGLSLLEVDWTQLTCSGLPTGSGWVRSAHGRLPVPAPATLELLRRANAPLRPSPAAGESGAPTNPPGELTTPTGELTVPTGEPTVPTGEPTMPTGEPTVPTGEPTMPTGEPTVPTGEPTMPTGELTTPTAEPTMPTGELTTPTGAALLTVLASGFASEPVMDRVTRVGYGFGTREMAWPNALRILIGDEPSPAAFERDRVVEIQTNLDDASPEELGFAMELLLAAGALDVAFSPLQMKKNRPGVLVRVLGRPEDGQRLAELVLEHTSALGVRLQTIDRLIARRSERSVTTPWGDVRVKVKHLPDREIVAPEYEDCARLARAAHVPLSQVYAAARSSL